MARTREVIVGVDGSETSTQAAIWAASVAQLHHSRLVLLYSSELYAGGVRYAAGPGTIPVVEAEEAAATLLKSVADRVHEHHRSLAIEQRHGHESAGTALIEATAQAQLTVVSTHGHAARVEQVLGSFAVHTAEQAQGPVAVVHGDETSWNWDGPVVVGTDGSASSEAAVEFAYEEAKARRVPLHVVHVWNDGPLRGFRRHADHNVDGAAFDEQQLEDLAADLAQRTERHGVNAVPVVLHGHPRAALRDYVSDQKAAVLVLGSGGPEGFADVHLGSTSRVLLTRSTVPVVVVPVQS